MPGRKSTKAQRVNPYIKFVKMIASKEGMPYGEAIHYVSQHGLWNKAKRASGYY